MEDFEGKIDCIDIDDVRNIQRLVIANSFENLKFEGGIKSVTLLDGATVRADVYDKKSDIALRKKPESQADVECAEPVPPLDSVGPFIQQLLFRERNFFTVKTAERNDWVMVRFTLVEPPSTDTKLGESSRNSITGLF